MIFISIKRCHYPQEEEEFWPVLECKVHLVQLSNMHKVLLKRDLLKVEKKWVTSPTQDWWKSHLLWAMKMVNPAPPKRWNQDCSSHRNSLSTRKYLLRIAQRKLSLFCDFSILTKTRNAPILFLYFFSASPHSLSFLPNSFVVALQ